jgi:hypothetical protein
VGIAFIAETIAESPFTIDRLLLLILEAWLARKSRCVKVRIFAARPYISQLC